MTSTTVTVIVTVALSSVGVRAQLISTDDVVTAIMQGRAGRTQQKHCRARGASGFDIVIEGPLGRIMRVAGEAREQRVTLTPDDVRRMPGLAAAELTVLARRDRGAAIPLENLNNYRSNITLKGTSSALVEPLVPVISYDRTPPFSYDGYKAASAGARPRPAGPVGDLSARFELAAFEALPAGEVDVVVFSSDVGEQRCTFSQRERAAIIR